MASGMSVASVCDGASFYEHSLGFESFTTVLKLVRSNIYLLLLYQYEVLHNFSLIFDLGVQEGYLVGLALHKCTKYGFLICLTLYNFPQFFAKFTVLKNHTK